MARISATSLISVARSLPSSTQFRAQMLLQTRSSPTGLARAGGGADIDGIAGAVPATSEYIP